MYEFKVYRNQQLSIRTTTGDWESADDLYCDNIEHYMKHGYRFKGFQNRSHNAYSIQMTNDVDTLEIVVRDIH